MRIIDFHTHIFAAPKQIQPLLEWSPLRDARSKLREYSAPLLGPVHRAQSMIRHLPPVLRNAIDEIGAILPAPRLLVESTADDLLDQIWQHGLEAAVVIAHPPATSNELVLRRAAHSSGRLIAAVNIPPTVPDARLALEEAVHAGARALKIHASSDGLHLEHPHYLALLEFANEKALPVILHTGTMHSHLIYKDTQLGRIDHFIPWIEKYSNTKFVLAHMGFHDPWTAIATAKNHSNVFVDTSWQPPEIIGEATRKIGAERVLFATDWPLLGDNIAVGIERVFEAVDTGLITDRESKLILGENAAGLLGIASV